MLRSHILQRTHITITLNPLGVSSDVGESYVCGALIIIFAIQWDLSYFVSRARVIYSCVCVCVCTYVCETLCVLFRCANRSRLDSNNSKQASDKCEGEVLHGRP